MEKSNFFKIFIFCALSLLLLAGCIGYAKTIQDAMYHGLTVCLRVMIPSLYAMLILTRLLTESGLVGQWGIVLGHLFYKIFRLPPQLCSVFLISQIAGYPVGALMVYQQFRNGSLTRKQASVVASVCFGGGPAFLLGSVGALFPNRLPCLYLFVSGFLSNCLLAAWIGRRLHFSELSQQPVSISCSAEMLVRCTRQAGISLLNICSMILCCTAPIGILNALPIFENFCQKLATICSCSTELLRIVCNTVLEISNICEFPVQGQATLPLLAGLLSFGGVCVLLQVSAVTQGQCSLGTLFAMRLAAGFLAALLCWLIVWVSPIPVAAEKSPNAVSVMSYPVALSGNSCLPGIMLVIMIGVLLINSANVTKTYKNS